MSANSARIDGVDGALHLVRKGRFGDIVQRIVCRVHKEWVSYGLRRDLTVPFEAPKARIPISVRPFVESDADALFPLDVTALTPEEARDLEVRRAHLEAGIPTCWVAVDLRNDKPCYMQWLMGAEQNEDIQTFFKGRFPFLRPDEALLENAYTPVEYRGKGIMPAGMALIAEQASQTGVRYVVTFVANDNVPSLKGCKKAGFNPYLTRRDIQAFFRLVRRRIFASLPDGFRMPYEVKGAESRNAEPISPVAA